MQVTYDRRLRDGAVTHAVERADTVEHTSTRSKLARELRLCSCNRLRCCLDVRNLSAQELRGVVLVRAVSEAATMLLWDGHRRRRDGSILPHRFPFQT